jgi:hypothetical protein
MQRRGFGYVTLLTLVITFGGAAEMYAIEKRKCMEQQAHWLCYCYGYTSLP